MDENFYQPPVSRKFFGFLDPLFDYMDHGRMFRQPFAIFYYTLAFVSSVGMIYGIYWAWGFASMLSGAAYAWACLMTIVWVAVAIFSFIYWCRRAMDVKHLIPEGARFQAMPAIASFLINLGEWGGLCGATLSACWGIFGCILLPFTHLHHYASDTFVAQLTLAIVGVVASYLFLVVLRFIGESIKALISIDTDMRKIADKA